MSRKGYGLRLAVCLAAALALCVCAAAEEAPLFSVGALRAYAHTTDTAFSMDGRTLWVNWRYAMESGGVESYRYEGGQGDAPRLQLLVMGSGEDGYPYLGLEWTDTGNWRAQTLTMRVGDAVYAVEMGTSQSFFHCRYQAEGAYAYSLLIPLGTCAPGLLSALRENDFCFRLRVYDKARARLAAQWDGGDSAAFERFDQGLATSGYLDARGLVQRSLWDGLAMIDGIAYFPKVTVYPADDALWPIDDGETLNAKAFQAAPMEGARPQARTRVALTGNGNWTRSGDMARFSLEVTNGAQDAAVAQLTFVCYVQENDSAALLSDPDGTRLIEAMEEVTVQPGRKATVSLRLDGMGLAAALMIGVQEVVYADGTVETVPLRDVSFVRCPF